MGRRLRRRNLERGELSEYVYAVFVRWNFLREEEGIVDRILRSGERERSTVSKQCVKNECWWFPIWQVRGEQGAVELHGWFLREPHGLHEKSCSKS